MLIYLTDTLRERAVLALHEALNPGGFLVLGKVEALPIVARKLFDPVNVAERVYRKARVTGGEFRPSATPPGSADD